MTPLLPAGELAVSKLHGLGNDFLVVLRSGAGASAAGAGESAGGAGASAVGAAASAGGAGASAGGAGASAGGAGASAGGARASAASAASAAGVVAGSSGDTWPGGASPSVAAGVTRPIDADLARRLCDRHLGIGADGLILGTRLVTGMPDAVTPSGSGSGSGAGGRGHVDACLGFQLWNADGSEAEMSGNGIRCLAHAALDAGWVAEDAPFGVITPAGRRQVRIRRGMEPGTTWATVEMGEAKVRGEVERCNVGHGQLLVDTGNPHLVVLGPDPATVDVARLGPMLEATDPAGLNVEFVALGPGPDEVTMRVWERGVGETRACGTGASAAAAALHHWGRVGRSVTVHQPGGSAAVELGADGSTTLSGPSVHIAACRVVL